MLAGFRSDIKLTDFLTQHAFTISAEVIPPRNGTEQLKILHQVQALVQAGATIVGMPPKASPSLSGYPDGDAQVRTIAKRLWGDAESELRDGTVRKVGAGTVIHDASAYRWAKQNPWAQARWIWVPGTNAPGENHGVRVFTRKFRAKNASSVDVAEVLITGSPSYEVEVNGTRLGGGHVVNQVRRLDATWLLKDGENEIRVTVDCAQHAGTAPFGVIASLVGRRRSGEQLRVVTDTSWLVSSEQPGSSGSAVDHGSFDAAPWKLSDASLQAASLYPSYRVTARLLAERGLKPDFEGDGMRAIHRRDGDEEIYFIANRMDRELAATCAFRVTGKHPEWWDAVTSERTVLDEFEEKENRTYLPVRLGAHESGFVVFHSGTPAKRARENFPHFHPAMAIEGAWNVSFDPKLGGPASVHFDRLWDWAERPDEGIRFYSGKAIYRIAFDAAIGAEQELFLSLGQVYNMASVRLNGRELGVVWSVPWRVSIPRGLLQAGGNQLEIEVANLWWNRLVRDSRLPEAERLTWIPEKYPFTGNEPLQKSGLLGPVRIETRK